MNKTPAKFQHLQIRIAPPVTAVTGMPSLSCFIFWVNFSNSHICCCCTAAAVAVAVISSSMLHCIVHALNNCWWCNLNACAFAGDVVRNDSLHSDSSGYADEEVSPSHRWHHRCCFLHLSWPSPSASVPFIPSVDRLKTVNCRLTRFSLDRKSIYHGNVSHVCKNVLFICNKVNFTEVWQRNEIHRQIHMSVYNKVVCRCLGWRFQWSDKLVRGWLLKEEVRQAQHRDERRGIKRCSTVVNSKPSYFVKRWQFKISNERQRAVSTWSKKSWDQQTVHHLIHWNIFQGDTNKNDPLLKRGMDATSRDQK